MSATIVNLTVPIVTEEIENVLCRYPHHPYQQAFAIPDLRQKLLVYVLSRVPNQYTVNQNHQSQGKNKVPYRSLALRLHIEQLVHQGIRQILETNAEWVDCHIPQSVDFGYSPSHWFG